MDARTAGAFSFIVLSQRLPRQSSDRRSVQVLMGYMASAFLGVKYPTHWVAFPRRLARGQRCERLDLVETWWKALRVTRDARRFIN